MTRPFPFEPRPVTPFPATPRPVEPFPFEREPDDQPEAEEDG